MFYLTISHRELTTMNYNGKNAHISKDASKNPRIRVFAAYKTRLRSSLNSGLHCISCYVLLLDDRDVFLFFFLNKCK